MAHAAPETPLPEATPEARDAATTLLRGLAAGTDGSVDALFSLVYEELRRVAHRYLHAQQGHTLNTTALVHEAYLRLVRQDEVSWEGRAHFRAVAARAMRSILIDYARSRATLKRGGGHALLSLDTAAIPVEEQAAALLVLDEALDELARHHDRLGRVVELRFFGGMTHDEIAPLLGVTVRTVERDWQRARAYLRLALA
jgi:RNA polymerase sigma factor (TIGR02999 family)